MVDNIEENLFNIFKNISEESGFDIIESVPLYGGDINRVYQLKSADVDLVLKVNDSVKFPDMFCAEMKGLQMLKHKSTFRIPEVLGCGEVSGYAYLLLEYIARGDKPRRFWPHFAGNLVKLHQNSRPLFGFDYSNYIGSLVQGNNDKETAAEFYIAERLEPMLRISRDNGYVFENIDRFLNNISGLIPDEAPALIHGDLWNGNYMVSSLGEAVLYDPAIAFAPREMDLAMMRLFGGFPEEVFSLYNEEMPLVDEWQKRIEIWQLYYILAHLNIFGAGYLASAKSIIKKFS